MKKWIGVALIAIMFVSSFAIAGIQSFSPPQTDAGRGQVELPSQPIIDYKMSSEQFSEALSRGFTVATYRYDGSCIECADERREIEQVVLSSEFQSQIILEEVQAPGRSSLEVESLFGKKALDTISVNSTLAALCEVATSPPLFCVNVQNAR